MQNQNAQDKPAATEVKVEASDSPAGKVTPPPATAPAPKVDAPAPIPIEDAIKELDAAKAKLTETLDNANEGIGDPAVTPVPVEKEKNSGQMVFLLGVSMLALFIWYFSTEIAKRKRIVGSILAIAVTAMSIWFFVEKKMEMGIEIQGGVSMDIRIVPNDGEKVTPALQEEAIKVLMNRFNAISTKEVVLTKQGSDMVFLQIPGLGKDKLEEIKAILEKVARLEFTVLDRSVQSRARAVHALDDVIAGSVALPYKKELDKKGNEIDRGYGIVKIKPQRELSGDSVKSASPRFGDQGWEISVSFTSEGSKIMGPLTAENKDQPLAIILDDVIISAPNINEPFSDGCRITGSFTQDEAFELASALNNPLKNPLIVEYSNYITPSMGAETVKQGMLAGIAGLILTLIFIVIYYRVAGVIAMIGMCVSISIIFGMMALFGFTLTLPGIAGIILTIGIAIDANVLIYERLREEMAGGKSLPSAIKTAYEKAFSAIIDANITTLITAIILFAVAVGTVKGFAVTLMIGILATLFSALLVTRVCFNWATETGMIKKLSFMNLVPEKVIDFLSMRKKAFLVSAVLLLISVIAIPAIDPRGVELAGGDSLIIKSEPNLTEDSLKGALETADFLKKEPIVQKQTPVGGGSSFFLVRSGEHTSEQIQEHLMANIDGLTLDGSQSSSVGSSVGKSMLINSALALGIGLIAVLLYVTLRFEFAFALGAIAALLHDLIITAGVTTLLGQEMSLISIGALLTIAGYSINDTIVVFDRVREGLATKRGDVKDVMNYCLNATLARTLLTSVTTLFIVIVLYLFGGPALRNFALVLIIGVMIGTYSSIFIASPIVLWWARKNGINLRREVLDTEQSKIDPMNAA